MTEFILGGNVFLSVILPSQVSGKERKKKLFLLPAPYRFDNHSITGLHQPHSIFYHHNHHNHALLNPAIQPPSHYPAYYFSRILEPGGPVLTPKIERERDREGKEKKKKNVTRKNSKHLAHHFPSNKFRSGGGAARRLAAYGGSWRLLD